MTKSGDIHYATTAKVQRSVALLHRFHNSANKNASYTIDFEVKVPSSDSVLSSLRTTGVPRHPHVRSLPFVHEASCQSPNMLKQHCHSRAWQFPFGRAQSLQRHVEASTRSLHVLSEVVCYQCSFLMFIFFKGQYLAKVQKAMIFWHFLILNFPNLHILYWYTVQHHQSHRA